MKKTQLNTEEITESGKFPAIKTTETSKGTIGAQTIMNTTVFRLDKVNAITLERKGDAAEDRVIIKMEGGTDLQYNCDSYHEAEEFFNYILDKW